MPPGRFLFAHPRGFDRGEARGEPVPDGTPGREIPAMNPPRANHSMDVHERLEEIFRTVFDDEDLTLTDETTSADIPGWDSLAHVNLMFTVEQEFGVQFVGNQFSEFENVGELRRFLESRPGR